MCCMRRHNFHKVVGLNYFHIDIDIDIDTVYNMSNEFLVIVFSNEDCLTTYKPGRKCT